MAKFRDIPMGQKVKLTVLIPERVDAAVRRSLGRRSLSEFTTEALCERLGLDPNRFNIVPSPTDRRRGETAATA